MPNHAEPPGHPAEMDAFRSAALPTARILPLTAHPLLGAMLLARETGDRHIVEQVLEGWWKGMYLLAVARELSSGVRSFLVVDHHDCLSEAIVDEFTQFKQSFEVLDHNEHVSQTH
ncbi:hypothetical protein G3A43_08260 [Paraburkholderia aspalathi]|nr:hypothetical protein [Paraburkholderia aspalathi]MBK3780249.1 hypothetical protein [Paraburkholderia aspalathi]